MAAPLVSMLGRAIWKKIEPITILVALDPGKTVLLDLVDETDTVLASGLSMTESTHIPGLYRRTFTPTQLDTYLGLNPTERLIAWRAYVSPTDASIVSRVGTFYRGGHVDLPHAAYIAPQDAAYASQDVPERFVEAGDLNTVDVDLGYSKILRRTLTYRPGSDDLDSMADEEIDA